MIFLVQFGINNHLYVFQRPQIIANSALRPRWLSIISYPARSRGIIVKYTIMAKPIKSFELHYPMIQFLINIFSQA